MTKKRPLKAVSPKKLPELKPFLDDLVTQVEQPEYIDSDPVSFLHAYSDKPDREIAGFFAALMAWGRRDIVMAKVEDLMGRMGHQPYAFIQNYDASSSKALDGFVHRTWNATDVDLICQIFQEIYTEYGSFEAFWAEVYRDSIEKGVSIMDRFHPMFFGMVSDAPARTRRHVGDAGKGSSCKRLWLYLRWCLRKDSIVDVGIMDFMPLSELMIPLDVHVARYARMLGLLTRPSNDWKAVVELTERLRSLDPLDPAKYDYALFGLGVLKIPVPDSLILNR
jgi:uncharacterized protein (TIGR02757 family)